ncbi:MAG: GNAT family N-acetyltransferase [Gammaproteobacteria bacterium]|nr:GNAT family N-acetyltransferase [Paracoccaceae bacterium]PCI65019.1 MAG: GNAT family N-acetyltransferase [Gammaproteobacteria bacterium]
MNKWLEETTLEGSKVKLVPLTASYRNELVKASNDGELWKLWFTSVPSEKNIDNYIKQALKDMDNGLALVFVVIDKKNNKVVGSTRYCNAVPSHRRVEIGYTWYSKSAQRTSINTECKHLLLTYAFEKLNAIAVEFRTHWHNHASRNAIERLGAKQDGVLRNHWVDDSEMLRDTVVFSIIQSEWKAVKQSLSYKLSLFS